LLLHHHCTSPTTAASASAVAFPPAGLHQLRALSLGWCRELGDTSSDPTNSVAALASLTALSSLSLAGTRVDDAQMVALLPQLQQLQVRASVLGLQWLLDVLIKAVLQQLYVWQ
jgi:hypothetical protein